MQRGTNPRRRLILPDLEHPARGLGSMTDAPPSDERTREGRIREIERNGIIEHAAHSRRGHRPSISAAILVEPCGYTLVPLAETARRNRDPDANRETQFSHRDDLARITGHSMFPVRSGAGEYALGIPGDVIPDRALGLPVLRALS